jgi:uncharacterized protein (TIGR03663 family)
MKRPLVLVSVVCILAVAVGALAIRLPRLASRPMHPDEANQAFKTGKLFDQGTYLYDPAGHHGPTLYYLTLPSLWLGGAASYADSQEVQYRIVPVVFGVGLVLALLVMGGGLGWPAAAVAACLTAISPAMVYYSRYYVQEMLLVFFTLGTIASAWRYARGGSWGWAVATGILAGLMYATKETWVLAAFAMVAGLALTVLWTRWRGDGRVALKPALRPWPIVAGAAAAVVVIVAFYSSFGTNWRGPLDSILSYGSYVHTAGESEHVHPWHYYLGLLVWNHPQANIPWYQALATSLQLWSHPERALVWTEGLIVGLAVVGIVAALAGRGVRSAPLTLIRFLAFYTLVLTAVYSAIPYKTPWCVLSMLSVMILMAGVGAVALVRGLRWLPLQVLGAAVVTFLVAHLAWQSAWLNFRMPADPRNPYVYAHSSTSVLKLAHLMDQLAAVSPRGHDMVVKVVVPQPETYWPLPWYLRKFHHVGYWNALPQDEDRLEVGADVIFISTDYEKMYEKILGDAFDCQPEFGLVHGINVRAYVRKELWKAYRVQLEEAGPASRSQTP